jgi:hypothetical protein
MTAFNLLDMCISSLYHTAEKLVFSRHIQKFASQGPKATWTDKRVIFPPQMNSVVRVVVLKTAGNYEVRTYFPIMNI